MNRNQAKEEIKKLVAKYEHVKNSAKVNSYTEEETKNAFVKPLFEALGWDFSEKEEVSAEEHISLAGRLDYGFHINRRPKFYLEVKKLKADLNNEEFARQAIKYSFNKGVTWAVLTDFEGIKVFNAQSPSKFLVDKQYFELKYSEYLERFDKLWELSKESFKEDLIDQKAIEAGKKLQKIPITELLSKDLNECRKILTEQLGKWNPDVPQDLLDEGVQKLLDRLIFIKVAEDRKIENNVLLPLINQWRLLTGSNKPTLYQSMTKTFRELDDIYNSNIFTKHPFETWEESGEVLEEVLNILNGKKGYYEFDFSIMSADTLGSVYENYLGYKLSQSQKGLILHKDAGKRKEQGIYYTPPFIVDYIVRNALGPILDNCTSVNDLKKIKVLDPACGSGSFLLKALEVIVEKYVEFNYEDNENLRKQILLDNIFGVDLDEQAVEIARLSLLISALKERGKLPSLENNIKYGNSLISGTDKELEKYFGRNFRDKKPFNWQEEFPEVFKQGGFDVIIGNPPYISYYSKQSQTTEETKDELDFYISIFSFIEDKKKLGRFNTLMFFIEKNIQNLKKSGYLGFLVDTNIHSNPSEDIRKYMVVNSTITDIVDELRAFQNVASSQLIFILKKQKPEKNMVNWHRLKDGQFKFSASKPQISIDSKTNYSFMEPKDDFTNKILTKIKNNPTLESLVGKKFVRTCITFTGKKDFFVKDEKIEAIDYPLLEGSSALPHPYAELKAGRYIRYDLVLRDRLNKEYEEEARVGGKRSPKVIGLGDLNLFKSPKIFIRLSDKRITASYTDKFFCADLSLYILTLPSLEIETKELSLFFLLGILNSRLITYFMIYSNLIGNLKTGTPQIRLKDVRSIPIPKINMSAQMTIIKYAKKTLDLNAQLNNEAENSNKWSETKSEIERTNKKIDEEVYKLYGLTPEEIKIVEGKNEGVLSDVWKNDSLC